MFVLFIILVNISCRDEQVTNNVASEIATLKKPIVPPADTVIDFPDALECGFYNDYIWEFNNFKPQVGKYIGIWPNPNRYGTNRIAELITLYGFTYAFGSAGPLTSAGFQLNKIMVGVDPSNYRTQIDNNGEVYAYYFDEPIKNNYPLYLGAEIRSYLQSKSFNNTKVSTGDYIRSMSLTEAASYCDFVMFTDYKHWYWNGFWWSSWPVDPDQRSDWTDMKTLFGSKFNQEWVSARLDRSSYIDLFGHANNLGLQTVWLFQADDETDDYNNSNIMAFCTAAWVQGYLKRISKRYYVSYVCVRHTGYSPCVCDIDNTACVWQVINKVYTGETRED